LRKGRREGEERKERIGTGKFVRSVEGEKQGDAGIK
jgi:hypothetical protein